MRCSGCGKSIPFAGDVCPYCQRDKSNDQNYSALAFVFGLGLAFLGGYVFSVWGAIGGFFIGCVIAAVITGARKSKPPEIHVTNDVTTKLKGESSSERLLKLKRLFDGGLIDVDEYKRKKKEILDGL